MAKKTIPTKALPTKEEFDKATALLRVEVKDVELPLYHQTQEYREKLVDASLEKWINEQGKYNAERFKKKKDRKFIHPEMVEDIN